MSLVDTAKDVYELVKKGATIDLQEKLIRLREEALSLQEENLGLRASLLELQKEKQQEDNVFFRNGVYWLKTSDGKEDGPFCQKCHDVDHKLVRLQDVGYHQRWDCLQCEEGYLPFGGNRKNL